MAKFPRSFDTIAAMDHLSGPQKHLVGVWVAMQKAVCNGDFGPKFDSLFHRNMGYRNPNRPDLTTYNQWKTSITELYKRFPPTVFRTVSATALGGDEIWVHSYYCGSEVGHFQGANGSPRMVDIESFSIVVFENGQIAGIRTLSDTLGLLVSAGLISPAVVPMNPYRKLRPKIDHN